MRPQPVPDARSEVERQRQEDRFRTKRDAARWYLVIGIAMIFAGAISLPIALGGLFTSAFGVVSYIHWGRRLRALEDPWDDAEIDAWEREHLLEGRD